MKDNVHLKNINKDELLAYMSNRIITNMMISSKVKINSKIIKFNKNLYFKNCVFKNDLEFENLTKNQLVQFDSCIFYGRVLFKISKFKKLKFLKCEFSKYFALNNFQSDNLVIEKSTIEGNGNLSLSDFSCKRLVFKENNLTNDVHLKPLDVEEVILKGSESNYEFTLSYENTSRPIKNFYVFAYPNYRTNFLLRSFSVKKLQILGSLKDASIYISNVKVNVGILHFFNNNGNFDVSKLEPFDNSSLIIIKNCSLGNLLVSNTNFRSFNRVILNDTNLTDIIPVNTRWCNDKNLESKNRYNSKENYRQLKLVSSKNEDVTNKLRFHEYEMLENIEILKNEKGKKADLFILLTNKWTNNFGNNYIKSLFYLILISIICYTAIKYLLGYTYFNLSLVFDEIGNFLLFINPLHKFKEIFGSEIHTNFGKGVYFFDAISRILGAYLLYQFIAAFRKYNRK